MISISPSRPLPPPFPDTYGLRTSLTAGTNRCKSPNKPKRRVHVPKLGNCVKNTLMVTRVCMITNHSVERSRLIFQVFLYLEVFECYTTSDWLIHTV